MSVYVIAKLSKESKMIGYRIYDTESKRKAEWQTSRVVEALKFNKEIKNVGLDTKGSLKGTMGALKNYPTVDIDTDVILDFNAYTIVGYDSVENIYHTVDAYGIPRPYHTEELLKKLDNPSVSTLKMSESYLKRIGINASPFSLTNATVVTKDGKRFIRGIAKLEDVGFKYKYLEKVFKTPNNRGQVKEWKVRIVKIGEPYGRQGCFINQDKPCVEFHSMDTNQFVASYYLETLLEHDEGYGLNLYGDVPAWSIEGYNFEVILNWLRKLKL